MGRAGLGVATLALLPVSAVLSMPSPVPQVSLLDVGGPAAFVRTADGRSVLLGGGQAAGALVASVAERLGLWERGLDLAVVTRSTGRHVGVVGETLRRYPAAVAIGLPGRGEGNGDAASGLPADANPLRLIAAQPGQRVELGGVQLDVVDVRVHEGEEVLDLRLLSDELAVWLAGPGAPSPRWTEYLESEARVILVLPAQSADWARQAPTLPLMAVVLDAPLSSRSDFGGAAVLDHRTFGTVEVTFGDGPPTLRTERCPAGRGCVVNP